MNKVSIVSLFTLAQTTRIHDLDSGVRSLAEEFDQENIPALA